jgi:hypothetical protein
MRDIVLYYQAQTGIQTGKLLSDGDDPNREAFLRARLTSHFSWTLWYRP